MNTTTATTNQELLAREIRAQYNGLMNALHTRRVHPSYGVTKKSLHERFNRLEGMLYAYAATVDGEVSAAITMQAWQAAADHFGFVAMPDLLGRIQRA